MRYYENRNEGHFKFYKISTPVTRKNDEDDLIYAVDTWRGVIGKKGRWFVYQYPTEDAALLGIEAIHHDRIKHGYLELKPGERWEDLVSLNQNEEQLDVC